MDDILIDGTFSNTNSLAKELWKDKFFGKWHVNWSEFFEALLLKLHLSSRQIGIDDIRSECMKELIGAGHKGEVSIQNFASLVEVMFKINFISDINIF